MMLLWIIGIGVGLLGAILLILGLRGRRIDDHPICRACRFDLVGVYHAPGVARLSEPCADYAEKHAIDGTEDGGTEHEGGAGVPPVDHCGAEPEPLPAPRCPECGRDLTRTKAVRIGARKKRPAFLTAGALMLLVTLSGVGAWGWGKASAFNWNTIKPTWLLIYEANSQGRADAALGELVRRAAAGKLPRPTHDSLIAVALEIQRDPNATWRRGWGDLVDVAQELGRLEPELFQEFVTRSLTLPISIRTPIMLGGSAPLEVEPVGLRAGSGAHGAYTIVVEFDSITIDEVSVEPPTERFKTRVAPRKGLIRATFEASLLFDAPGEHALRVFFRVWTRSAPAPAIGGVRSYIALGDQSVEGSEGDSEPWILTSTTRYEVLPPGVPGITLTPNPALLDAIRSAVLIDRPKITRGADGDKASMAVVFVEPPVDVAFEIFVLAGGKEISLGQVAGSARGTIAHSIKGVMTNTMGADLAGAAILFRASAIAARQHSTLTEIWDGEFIIDSVPWTVVEEP